MKSFKKCKPVKSLSIERKALCNKFVELCDSLGNILLYKDISPNFQFSVNLEGAMIDEELFDILGVTVLLSLTVFQDSVSATMPITSLQIPLLGNPGHKCC